MIRSQDTCGVCFNMLYLVPLISCRHKICRRCFNQVMQTQAKCPFCRNQMIGNESFDKDEQERLRKLDPQKYDCLVKALNVFHASILIGNTARESRTTQGYYDWNLYIKPLNGLDFKRVLKSVTIGLHPTFRPSQKLEIARSGWGVFEITIKIQWAKEFKQDHDEFVHMLSFKQKTEAVKKVKNIKIN